MQVIRVALLAFALAACAAQAGSSPLRVEAVQQSGLTSEQAQQVLMVVLEHERFPTAKEGFFIEALTPSQPGYQDFGVTFESPNAAATTVLGAFAVSKMTGDIWETNLCKRYEFPELESLQAKIMARTGKTFAAESKERRSLGCTDE